ncbi:MAG: hypothetical protein Q7J73_08955 [Dehalococcoidales bacterium]|nr:hypothetical protein [Dehalococcoidales bacterium]
MVKAKKKPLTSEPVHYEPEAIIYFKQAILSGKHWYIALLEAVRLWDLSEEDHNGRTYRYVIDGEAIDWLLIAERLCEAAGDTIPEAEKTAFLFHGEPPLKLSAEEFKELIGDDKHHQYLNYFYGVTVEESLVIVVEEEVRKERRLDGLTRESDVITNEAYRRIYGSTRAILLRGFRKEKSYSQVNSVGLSELKQFTYWLFKYRLKHNEKAKTGSDTKKALIWLNNQGFARQLARHDPKAYIVIPV